MTALRWSSFIECMKRVLCWPWTNSAYVCIARSSNLKVLLVFDAVCMMLQSHALFCCPNTLLTVVFAWVDKHTARTFGLLAAYVLEFDTYYWCSLQHELVISSSSCAVQKIHYNGGDASALVFVGWMYETGIVSALDEQNVRLHSCMRAQIGTCYWCSKQYI